MFSFTRAHKARARAETLKKADDEAHCQFASSKGLMKCCEVHQPLPNHAADKWPIKPLKAHRPGGRIYVHATALKDFVRSALPRISSPFVLVSGDSVLDVCAETLGPRIVEQLVNHPQLIRWHTQNLVLTHPKVHPLPLGLDYHTMDLMGRPDWGPGASPRAQEGLLHTIRQMSAPLEDRKIQGYSNWHFALQNGDRAQVIETIPREACHYEPERLPRRESWMRNTGFFFTISPRGVGLDCHRTWEAIVLGSAPVIPVSPVNGLFKSLPVVTVEDWSKVTPGFLAAERDRILAGTFDFAPVFLETWKRRLHGAPEVPDMKMSFQEFARLSSAEIDGLLV